MTLARKLCGLVALVGSAVPATAQYAPPRPAPQGPTRLVFVAPPWITNGPRTGLPAGAGLATPHVNEVPPAPMTPQLAPLPPAPTPGTVVPAVPTIPPAPPAGVTPAGATAPRTAPGPRITSSPRPDVWRAGTVTLPGTIVPAPGKSK